MGNAIFKSLLEKNFMIEVEPDWSLPEMIKILIEEVGRHIAAQKDIKKLLAMLPRGSFSIIPNSPVEEQHKYIVTRYGKIDKSNPRVVLSFMENFVSEAAALERKTIAYGATRIADISADELVLLTDHAVPLAMDKFWCKWFHDLVIPLEILPEGEKIMKKKELKKIMNEYDYTILRNGERITWAEAFPEETKNLLDALRNLETRLHDKQIRNYISSLITAHSCIDIDHLEKLWTDVDYAWIRIPKTCRVFPVHGMESGYEHPYGVSPEWRIMVRLNFGKEEVKSISSAAPSALGHLGLDTEVLKRKLDFIDIGVFYTAIWSGTCLNFRGSGQAVPNRQNVLVSGGKIFMDLDSTLLSVERYKGILRQYFSKETADVLCEYIEPMSMMEHTAGHEVSHPAGRSRDIDHALGDALKLLEESKATMAGNLINEFRNENNRMKIVAESLARLCRFFSKTTMENPVSIQYVWENMVACKTMHMAGLISVGKNEIEVDLEKAKSRAWFKELENFIELILSAYKKGDIEILEKIHRELCNKNEGIIAEVIALVNKKK